MTTVLLRRENNGWSIYAPKGHKITGPKKFKNEAYAVEWACSFAESFGWYIKVENPELCEKRSM